MTSIGLFSQTFNSPGRLWLPDDHGTEYMPGVPIDLSLFTQAQHYPNGYVPSGCLLAKNSTSGKYGPYLGTATDGRQNVIGILFNDISVYAPQAGVPTLQTIVSAPLLLHGFVSAAKLPFTSTNAADGGYLDTAAQTALKNIVFVPAVP